MLWMNEWIECCVKTTKKNFFFPLIHIIFKFFPLFVFVPHRPTKMWFFLNRFYFYQDTSIWYIFPYMHTFRQMSTLYTLQSVRHTACLKRYWAFCSIWKEIGKCEIGNKETLKNWKWNTKHWQLTNLHVFSFVCTSVHSDKTIESLSVVWCCFSSDNQCTTLCNMHKWYVHFVAFYAIFLPLFFPFSAKVIVGFGKNCQPRCFFAYSFGFLSLFCFFCSSSCFSFVYVAICQLLPHLSAKNKKNILRNFNFSKNILF